MNTNLALGFLYSGDIWDEDTPYQLHDVGYEMLAELKGKDLVEVVRCEDCKHSVISHGRYCVFGDCSGCLVANDFFCKYGERRGTE